MSGQDKKQLNTDGLLEIKSLLGNTPPASASLEEILAEFRPGKTPEETQETPQEKSAPPSGPPKPPRPAGGEKVVPFPGQRAAPPPPPPEQAAPPPPPEERQGPAVLHFPEEESALKAFLKELSRKANNYADQMYQDDEETDPEEVRRLERLIPGTDREEEPEEDGEEEDVPLFRRPRRREPPPPDLSPRELSYRWSRGLTGLRVRALLVLLLAAAALAQVLAPALGLVWPEGLAEYPHWIAVALLGAGTLLSGDVLLAGLGRALRLKFGMDTLFALACAFTLADGVLLALSEAPARLPYTAVVLPGLFCQLHGTYHKRQGLRLSCRTAAASASPYRVTLDLGKWNNRDVYVKWPGEWDGFGSQIQTDDGAQRVYRRMCPLLLLGTVLLAVQSPGAGEPEHLVWTLSALFTACSAYGAALAYGRPFHKAALRLSQSGAALAGWPGVAASRRGDRVLITDADLFPPGYVELGGYKIMRDFPQERVLAYAATLIRDSGSGLARLFHDHLRAMGGLLRRADSLQCHEGGGLSANIRGDSVLVGSAAFMNLMEVPLPQGLHVKNAVFCAINGELAGIFTLHYTLPDTVFPALEELLGARVGPVLATRDFNLIPAMLQQRFKLAADRMDFPPVERRRELSDPGQPHGETLVALLCREGLFPLAEAVTAAKRLRWAARTGAVLCCVGSTLGLLLCAYLTSVRAYSSLSPLNLLVYMLTWLLPVWFLSGWVHRF
ncbi:MAG: hypothetical protein HFF50_10030 [Lawsonibacter sp.]|nr:hypothetical protein [Lawsonibacter sp.]